MNHLIFIGNAWILFTLMQFFGEKLSNISSLDFKYDTLTFHDEKNSDDKSFGYNMIYNILFPNIYIYIVANIFKDEARIHGVYWIVIYYFIIKFIVIIFVLGRILLINFQYQFLSIIICLILTYFNYHFIILNTNNIFMSIEDFKNEILLLLILFIYDVIKSKLVQTFSSEKIYSAEKKVKYIKNKHNLFKSLFEENLLKIDPELNKNFQNFIFSIMIYENFCRPPFIRKVETIFCQLSNKEYSQGIMQIKSTKPINDEESLKKAVELFKKKGISTSSFESSMVISSAYRYNEDVNYANEVACIFDIIND